MRILAFAFAITAAALSQTAGAITATKEYVDRKDATNAAAIAVLDGVVSNHTEHLQEIDLRFETTPTLGDVAAVEDKILEIRRGLGTNVSHIVSNVVTKSYVEDLGISGGGGGGGLTTNDVCAIVTNTLTLTAPLRLDGLWLAEGAAGDYQTEAAVIDQAANTVSWRLVDQENWIVVWNYEACTLFDPATGTYSYGVDAMPLGGYWVGDDWVADYVDVGTITYTSSTQTVSVTRNALGLARLEDLPSTNGLLSADAISTNNAAFVTAVTNCPVVIASADSEALTEWGIYGGGGTIGALLAALAAAVAALKKKKMPLYPVGGTGNPVNATLANGVLTISPFAMAAYTPTASAAFSVAMGALPSDMESGKARDAVLVIDCTSLTEGQEPTVTWDTHFHPRTNIETDLAIVEAGKRAVFYISEYAAGEFAVGGWVETEGGNT